MNMVFRSPTWTFQSTPTVTPPAIRVGFLVAGTQKGGTATLDACLRLNTNICMGLGKELHYFDDDKFFVGGPNHAAYHFGFDHRRASETPPPVFGEATPIYMWWQPAAARIKAYNPDMKWILLLRNPVERAYSQWNMNRHKGRESRTFMAALLAEQSLATVGDRQDRVLSYVDRGRYARQIRSLWTDFSPQQFLILKTDDLKTDLQGVADRVCGFLGVPAMPVPADFGQRNATAYPAAMPDDARAWLTEIFAREIRELEELLGWDCRSWLT